MKKKHHGKHKMNCRFCENTLEYVFIDLGKSPLANSYVKYEDLNKPESTYPLRAFVCSNHDVEYDEKYA